MSSVDVPGAEEALSLFEDLVEVIDAVPERYLVLRWLVSEWKHYANEKFGFVANHKVDDHDQDMREHGFDLSPEVGAFWPRQIGQYWDRASLFSVGEDPAVLPHAVLKGRQALMKALVTHFDCCGCMIRVHGLPPAPGHTSGEIEEWNLAEQ